MTTAWTYRARHIVETEIAAARCAFLAADEAGDYDTADAQYRRIDDLLHEWMHQPPAGTP